MQEVTYASLQTGMAAPARGELFSILLRLHPIEVGWVSPGAGREAHAAFLDIVRQNDEALAEQLHQPNQRRPFTVGLLQGFNHLTAAQLEEAMTRNRQVQVSPGQVYWLRITILDTAIFGVLFQHLITKPRTFIIRLGEARFEVSRLIGSPEPDTAANSWAAYSSFADLSTHTAVQREYAFEFATPTAFSMGQKSWGKVMNLLPEPAHVFESLARQWEVFAPAHLRLTAHELNPRDFVIWCAESLIVARYRLETRYLPSNKFAQPGFQGTISYELKRAQASREARWLTPLAHFALFSGVGYKTSMGMGQTRCINLTSVKTASAGNAEETTGE
ncbi:MAG TPA: CRISPR-associated endoribonuclease Cas6 [Ktedonobacteraceae bacterium]|nr:CRISPR-associated endoribonuclease Cas6 [Ktedonobacteraceae bacterium]